MVTLVDPTTGASLLAHPSIDNAALRSAHKASCAAISREAAHRLSEAPRTSCESNGAQVGRR